MSNSKQVLLLIETSRGWGRDLLEGIGRYAMAHGSWSLCVSDYALDASRHAWIGEWKGDGIIFWSPSALTSEAIRRGGVPAVDTSFAIVDHGFPAVCIDERAVAEMAVDHFLERQFTNFGFCAIEDIRWVKWRREAYVSLLEKHGFACHAISTAAATHPSDWPRQSRQLGGWVRDLPKPIGVFAANDVAGMRLLDACREADIAVPEQVAVLGVDTDTVLTTLTSPPMSSIDVNIENLGYEAAALLDRLMAGEPAPREPVSVHPAGIVVRQSTDTLAVDDCDIVEALRFIRHHAHEGISVADLVKNLNISRATLERRFGETLGRTPKEEILRVSIEKAKRFLTLTDYTLQRIAGLCGFKTASHFGVVFKRVTGMSPKAFRDQVE
ncbi:MAG: DNA-binding transcriptional regulator [Pirellulales bacterium]|nr:DNA-binding transcriptional regulator [Pirellulales bacterium]